VCSGREYFSVHGLVETDSSLCPMNSFQEDLEENIISERNLTR